MQIHELNRPRRTNEGIMDVVRGVGGAAKTALATAAGIDPNAGAASAGILDPAQKLAAVMKNPDMVKLATQYADEWLKDPRSKVQAQAQAVPEDTAVATPGTYNKKTGAAKLGGKTMTALSDLPPAVQQQIQAKQQELEKQTGRPNPYMAPAAQQPTAPVDAQRFNYNNVAKMPGVANAATATQAQTPPAVGSRVNKADPNNPNIKDQTKYVQGRAGSGTGGDATKFAKYDPATSAVANAGQGINNMIKGGVTAQAQPGQPQQPATTAPAAGTAMPLKPFQVPGVGTNPNPNPTATPNPNSTPSPTTPASTATRVTNPAKAKYLKDFLEFANEKIAMRDPTTYKMIGLTSLYTAVQKYSLKTELDTAKQAVIKAQGDPVATKEAVKNYILTALAAAQLMASGNKLAAATPQAPALGRQTPAPGKAGTVATTTTPTTSATGQPIGSNAVALITQAGLPAATLAKAGQFIQTTTGNRQLSTTGDSVIDTMLEGMGYTVS